MLFNLTRIWPRVDNRVKKQPTKGAHPNVGMLRTHKKKGVFVSWKKKGEQLRVVGDFFRNAPTTNPRPIVVAFCLFIYLSIYSLPKGIFWMKELPPFSKLSVGKFQNTWHVSISPFILLFIRTFKKKYVA
jgi:hypothetical protein